MSVMKADTVSKYREDMARDDMANHKHECSNRFDVENSLLSVSERP